MMKYAIEYIKGKARNLSSFDDNDIIPGNLVEIPESQLSVITKEIEQNSNELGILLEEKNSILKWFSDTDYIPNKIVTGEWEKTDPRWIEYLSTRLEKRARQDELTVLIESEMA